MKKNESKQRVAAYIRVSDEEQVEGYSLEAQRTEIERWCQRQDYDLVRVYADEGKSAYSDRITDRPELVRLLADVHHRTYDIVVVHTLDRWARNMLVQCQALQGLGDARVGFASVMENIDFTAPAGKLLLTVMGGVAEFFSAQLGVHVSKAFRQKVSLGLHVGPLPFGYTKDEDGRPKPTGKEADAVVEVFQRRASGESFGTIARWLNDAGYKSTTGKRFTPHAVRDLVACEFYLGLVEYKGELHPGRHPALVSQGLFDAVQSRRGAPPARGVVGTTGLLQGRVFCIRCGKAIQSDRHRQSPMYRERHAGECATNEKSVMAHRIDAQVAPILESLILPKDWRERMVRLALTRVAGPTSDELKQSLKRLGRAYADGLVPEREYEERRDDLNRRMREVESQDLPSIPEAAELFDQVEQMWKEATQEERKRLVGSLFERAYVDLETGQIGAIVPVPAFKRLLENALERSQAGCALLLSPAESERLDVWSWWRRGGVEPPVQKGLRSISHKLLR